ncbi:TPA: glycerol-3-phosphate dehydrogenase [Legionella pneumophila]|uniref:Glycerol-3-phosphate dehydrogenase n=1 Tax=Legionella pneumophila TaxID=446 RepID=A0A2S6EZB5_LEGPN|nr:glycerol-3-phosphate dehydrogenase [Legionella pneumophila]APF03062.1 glycerol-3-phosphate dehydrogenase [Legionella pneumophila subsp. fraseri]APF06092.1 glycerol-3-phosphate dehydrogenase [Legionella pneumophila subsp. fraseri]AUB68550.1 glycerol-3-phosphate dehydrogenase [Legionella pneumophila]AUB71522.1 glycerol-3-phosphate dehydrogenase [Legionella pneumophila]KXB24061.1 glycerol-3-phosphate dehydrogenase [Legionella pneumophila]
MDQVFDVAIIGGGINGCGCAADAALRGLSVVLFEQDDLASKTSSSSTKLIHGGLRYLEHYEFGLVKKALQERQTLLNLAPHLVHSQSFVLPYLKHMRPSWLLRLGLFFYDHLSRKNHLPKSKSIHRNNKNNYFTPLKEELNRGFLFYDATTDDARLTILNAIQAKNHGASIRPHAKVTHAEVINNIWHLTIQPTKGQCYKAYAKTIINAAGPWVQSIAQLTQTPIQKDITLVKGSHIIVPKLFEGNHAYFLQHNDQRVIFVIPYHGFSMIGTTDIHYTGDLNHIEIGEEEIDYLIELVNAYFKFKITKGDIVHSWSGIRPLLADDSKETKSLSRDYSYEFYNSPAPIITIFGGKITTYRQLAEEVINQLTSIFPRMKPSKTKHTPLPGATLADMSFAQYVNYARTKYHWLDDALLNRYLNTYGCYTEIFLSQCSNMEAMGKKYGPSLYQVEVDYLILEEWANYCDDILNRRTKLGLTMDNASKKELADYLASISNYPSAQAELVFH